MSERRKDSKGRVLRTGESERKDGLYQFRYEDTIGKRHLDMFVILAGTGMRISEFAALTIQDIDFARNVIHVDKQIVRLVGRLTITKPKSENGVRDIPMTQEVRQSAMNLIRKRNEIKLDVMIDGCVGFLSVTRNGRPSTHSDARTTLNIYTDNVMDKVYESMELLEKRCN